MTGPVDADTGRLLDGLLASFAQVHGGITFDVRGRSGPKGSTETGWHGRQYNRKSGTAWTAAVIEASNLTMRSRPPITGPVFVHIDFWRPRSGVRKHEIWHAKQPDIDKLLRATLDGLTGSAIEDDARVAALSACKRYLPHVRGGRTSTIPDGARITIVPLGGHGTDGYDLRLEPRFVDPDGPPSWTPTDPGTRP